MDVEAELEIDRKLSRFPVPNFIWQEFYLDQEINDRGILVDMQLADKAINLDAKAKEELTAEVQKLTGVENPNSVYQLLDWLETQGYKSDSLGKTQVAAIIVQEGCSAFMGHQERGVGLVEMCNCKIFRRITCLI